MLVMLVIPVMLFMCYVCYVLCLVSFYLPLHPFQRVKINFFKSLSGSTCLTGFNWFEVFGVFGVFGVFEVFKVVRGVQRFYSYNPLSKNPTLSKSP